MNTHPTETHNKFIELRVQGLSYQRIAQELNVCKRTVVNWSRKFHFDIQNRRAIEMEALQEELIATREVRARALAAQLRQVEQELSRRDVSTLSTGRLFALAESLRRQIRRETGDLQFSAPVDDVPEDEYHERVQDWAA